MFKRNSVAEIPAATRATMQREADMDLLVRLVTGSIVYPIMLVLLGATTPYCNEHPILFGAFVATIGTGIAVRITIAIFRKQLYARSRSLIIVPLAASIFLSTGAAGLLYLSVASIYGFSSWTFAVILMWTVGIASGSTISFIPSYPFLILQLLLLLGPGITYELLLGSTRGLSLGIAMIVFLAFHLVQGYRMHLEFWEKLARRALDTIRNQELEAAKLSAEQAQEKLRYQATHDLLTGVKNHAQILSDFDLELERSIRCQTPFGILMLDLDHFKQVNDRYGHLAGDEVLRSVAACLRASIRSYDKVGRYGGEEFLILLPGCDLESSATSAERIRQAIEKQPVQLATAQVSVTVSGGVAVFDPDADVDSRRMVARADHALYQAKREGRNRVVIDSMYSGAVCKLAARA